MITFLNLIHTGLKRRRKEMRYVSLVTFIAVLFLSSVTLFQNCMDKYLIQTNLLTYGNWILSATKDHENPDVLFEELNHPYFTTVGVCQSGGELLDQNDRFSDVYFGAVDEAFCELANLTIYEGRLPQSEEEIAMDLSSLSRLGYSYQLDQTIRIAVKINTIVHTKNFRLVGTIKSFADNWKYESDYHAPNCIVTLDGLNRVHSPLYTTYYYQLGKEYESLNMEEFTSAFLKPKYARVYNSYVYDNRVWGPEYMFWFMKLVLIFAGALAVGYLMMSYVSQRRKWYYMLRSFGTDKTQIKMIILAEVIYGTFPYALCAILLPCLAGALLCFGISAQQQLPSFFAFRLQDFGMWVLASFGIILFAVLCAWFQIRDKSLDQNRYIVTKRQLRRLHRHAGKERNTGRIFFQRQRLLHPLQRTASVLFSCIICSVLCLCLNQILNASQTYLGATEGLQDFEASQMPAFRKEISTKNTPANMVIAGRIYDMYYGIDSDTKNALSSLIGVDHIDWQFWDQTHILQWENKKNSVSEQQLKRFYEEMPHSLGLQFQNMIFCYFEDTQQILKELKKDFALEQFDEKAFRDGEQIIVMQYNYKNIYDTTEATYQDALGNKTLLPGDTAEIVSGEAESCPVNMIRYTLPEQIPEEYDLPGCVPVTVGAVLEASYPKWANLLPSSPFVIIGSRKLAERVAKADGKTIASNHIFIDLNKNQTYESTQKRLVSIFKEHYMTYNTGFETRQQALHMYMRQLSTYSILFCIILFLFLLLQIHFQQIQNQYLVREYVLLKQLGMDSALLGRITLKEGLAQAVWMLFSLPCCYAASIIREFLYFKNPLEENTWSELSGTCTDDKFLLSLESAIQDIHLLYTVIFILLLMLLLILIIYLSAKKYEKRRMPNENSFTMYRHIQNLRNG